MAHRFDDLPPLVAPVLEGASGLAAATADGLLRALARRCTIEREGSSAATGLLCLWHEDLFLYALTHLEPHDDHLWMQDPSWYVRPVHHLLARRGGRYVLGSKGSEGRAAVRAVAEHLAGGGTTVIAPDGPAGPPRRAKPGVLHMARESGVAITPVRFVTSNEFRVPGWDGKRLPRPGATVRVRYGPVVSVGDDLEEARARLEATLR